MNLRTVSPPLQASPARSTWSPQAAAWATALRSGSEGACRQAAAELVKLGPEALPVLCAALEDYLPSVRITAARALGELGNAEAVPALTAALRREMTGKTGARHFWLGLLLLSGRVLVGLVLAVLLVGLLILLRGQGWQLLKGLAVWYEDLVRYVRERRSATQVMAAIAMALAVLAEKAPDPRMREVLPDLEMVGMDLMHHDARSREMNRMAVHRIDVLTRHLKDLPLPSQPPAPDMEALPIPSGPRSHDDL